MVVHDTGRKINITARRAGISALLIGCIFLSMITMVDTAVGKTICVNFTGGSDENGNGDPGSPYKTITRALRDVPSKRFTQEYVVEVTDSGTSVLSRSITIASKGGNRNHGLIIKAANAATIDINGSWDGFHVSTAYVTIDGFRIRGLVPNGKRVSAIFLEKGASHCKIRNNEIKGAGVGNGAEGDVGITVRTEWANIIGCEITNNTIHDFQQEIVQPITNGIIIVAAIIGGDCIVKGNIIRNCTQGIQLSAIESTGKILIEGNEIYSTVWHDPADIGVKGIIVSNTGTNTRIYVSKNILTNLGYDGIHFTGIVRGNPCVISNNFISGIGTYGIWLKQDAVNAKIYNNTIKDVDRYGIYINALSTGADIKSNIISLPSREAYAIYVDGDADKGFSSNYNAIHCENPKPMYWKAAPQRWLAWQDHDDGKSITDDPELEKDSPRHLRSGSKCVDLWDMDPTGGLVTDDIDGDPRPQNGSYDVGADEVRSYLVGSEGKQLVTWGKVKRITLYQNYPNPFNPETWIPFQLAEASDVTIGIYHQSGQLIRTLSLGHKEPGMYLERTRAGYWDGRNDAGEPVASGVYFYRLEAGDSNQTGKMTVLW